MIAKCIAILTIVAQMNVLVLSQRPGIFPNVGSCSLSTPIVSASQGNSYGSSAVDVTTKNLIGKSKYQIALKNNGPALDRRVPVITSRVTAPVQEKPTVRLSSPIPAPRTVAHSCTCFKTIVKPTVHQQIITVPSVQRYVQTSYKPVVEHIQYEGIPIGSDSPSSGSPVQLVEIPPCEYPQFQRDQISTPQLQVFQIPQFQSFQFPDPQTIQVPDAQISEAQNIQVPEVQNVQVSEFQNNEPQQNVQIPPSFCY